MKIPTSVLSEDLEIERYELFEGPWNCANLTRRDLFRALGAGILIVCLGCAADGQQESGGGRRGGFGGQGPREVDAWIHIGEDGTIRAMTGKVEVGQNSRTSLTQAVAEEMRISPNAIRLVMGDTDLTPYDAGTFGSGTTPRMWPQLRRAGAAAREALIDLAAEQWKVDRASLQSADGKITHAATGKSASYGQLSGGRKLVRTISGDIALTPANEWKVAGHSIPKIGAKEIVTGAHKYSSDVKRPGMLYGRILRPEAFGAKLESLDSRAAEAMPGVKVVHEGEFVGVVAPDRHQADQALEAIKAQWKSEPQPSGRELFDLLKKSPAESRGGRGGREGGGSSGRGTIGSMEAGLAESDVKLQATYTVAYIAHIPLEPRAAVAEWQDGKLTVWTGTQRPFGVKSELANALGIPESQVHVLMPDTGSGYGGKHTGEAAVEAARLAKAAGKPVKLVWTREEEFTWAYARPAGVIEVNSGVKKDGTLLAWEFHNYNSGGSAIQTPYDAPNRRIEFHGSNSPLRQGSYRALASTANNFARESHMDELARALKMDPVEFRLKNLKDERLRAVLQAAAERFGWGKTSHAANRGFGIACGTEKGGYVATCVELEVAASHPNGNNGTAATRTATPVGRSVKLVRAVTAFECGAIVNPEHLKNQVEGAVIMGIGGALFEAIEFENGRILNPRFSKYRVPRFGDVPALETVLLDRKDLPSAGAGESPIIGIAPAIGNAIFDATGIRCRSMPMLPKLA